MMITIMNIMMITITITHHVFVVFTAPIMALITLTLAI